MGHLPSERFWCEYEYHRSVGTRGCQLSVYKKIDQFSVCSPALATPPFNVVKEISFPCVMADERILFFEAEKPY